MPKTEDYEYLLELENVRAVEMVGDTLFVRVSKKLPDEQLDWNQNLENIVMDVDFVIIDENEEPDKNASYDLLYNTVPEGREDRSQKIRPPQAGISEMHIAGSAATGGHFPAIVVDNSKGKWSDDIKLGDKVRLSNHHVYGMSGDADFGDKIIQPSPMDGGDHNDAVGRLVGYVPFEDGVSVDIAARDFNNAESSKPYSLEDEYGGGVFRGDYEDLHGRHLVKTGYRTGVTSGIVESVGASVNVNMGDGTVKFRNVMITTNMGSPGDSGSPVYVKDTGEIVATLFAGSPRSTILCRVDEIEESLGVEILPNDNGEPDDPPEEDDVGFWCRLLQSVGIDRYVPWC